MRRRLAPLVALFAITCCGVILPGRSARAAPGTVTPEETPSLTAELPTATPRPTWTPRPTRTPAPTATKPPVRREGQGRHHKRTPVALPVATSTPKAGNQGARKHHHRHHRHRHRAKPTATPTATPDVSLQVDNSIAPVMCNGAGRPVASRPFLTPPFHGWTSIVSYFDHDLPDYAQDGLIVTAGGWSAQPDRTHSAPDFPAYWNSHLRQYLYYDGHNGYDYNLWYQPVYAAAPGRVIFAGWEYPGLPAHGYGKMVMIDHHNGYVTLYGHFSRFLVHKGEKVKRGEQIGVSGNTGHSSGPHLHFSVFHNCSPTDPYGWTGNGSDPLQSYQGETSEYLWKRQPLIANPSPGWPGSAHLPANTLTRLALLKLPTAARGTRRFTRSLAAEAQRAIAALRHTGVSARADLLKGVVVITGSATAEEIESAPGVVSLTTPDTEEGERADVLAGLAQAALLGRQARFRVARSTHWTGSVVRWQGRAFLVGRGERGKRVDLRLRDPEVRQTHTITADPGTGAYAVDLGAVSSRQMQALIRDLQGRGSGGSSASIHDAPTRVTTGKEGDAPTPWLAVLGALALLLAGGVAGISGVWWRREHGRE